MNKGISWFLALALLFIALLVFNSRLTVTNLDQRIDIVTTAGLYGDMMGYDYLMARESSTGGMSHISAILREMRKESESVFLLDLGGTLQGSFLVDYVFNRQKKLGVSLPEHPILRAVDEMEYAGFSPSYHELSRGITPLQKQADLKFFNANIYSSETDARIFEPFMVLQKTLRGRRGIPPAKVGVVGFVAGVNSSAYQGVNINEITTEYNALLPTLQEQSFVAVALVTHLGSFESQESEELQELILPLTKLQGVNVVIVAFDVPGGHGGFSQVIEGVQVIAPPTRGLGVSVSSFSISYNGSEWILYNENSKILRSANRDPAFDKSMQREHDAILDLSLKEVASLDRTLTSDFAMIEDSHIETLVNQAQISYVEEYLPEAKRGLPIISLSPPYAYSTGISSSGSQLLQGPIRVSDLVRFYQMPGTLVTMQVTGRDIAAYLEWVSQAYLRVSTTQSVPQYFINKQFPIRQFAMIDGLTYEIDLTQPNRYRGMQIATPAAKRVVNLRYKDRPVRDAQQFLLVVNSDWLKENPFLSSIVNNTLVFDTNVDVRAIILNYIDQYSNVDDQLLGNWKLIARLPATAPAAQKDTQDKDDKEDDEEEEKVALPTRLTLHFLGRPEAADHAKWTRYIRFIRRTNTSSGIYEYDPNMVK